MSLTINSFEDFILNKFPSDKINEQPKTEQDLLSLYCEYSDLLYQYVRCVIKPYLYPLNNEIRAMFGHLAECKISPTSTTKLDLEKAYGHFRRLNLDLFKLICNGFDQTLSKKMKKQYRYDFRNSCSGYLKEYSSRYFEAKRLYINAQEEERLGCDSDKHNVILLYYKAATEYIKLKQYYQENKCMVIKTKMKSITIKTVLGITGILGVLLTIVDLIK